MPPRRRPENALAAGVTECGGGVLLLLGLFSRAGSVPLMFTMLVADATAEREALPAIFSDPDKFTSAAPFQFLLTAVTVFTFGPGRWSLDAWWFGPRRAEALLTAAPQRAG